MDKNPPITDTPVREELIKKHEARIDRLVGDYERRIVNHLEETYSKETKWPDRLADQIARFGGSWRFILIFSVFLASWLLINTLPFIHHFDGPPFILLNLILSFIAAFQAPIIMMSQNRQATRDKQEAVIDFAINYKAEQEVDDMQKHLHRIESELHVIRQFLETTQQKPDTN
nr:DUF1003 domain-containing protein [Bacilli bacterium]